MWMLGVVIFLGVVVMSKRFLYCSFVYTSCFSELFMCNGLKNLSMQVYLAAWFRGLDLEARLSSFAFVRARSFIFRCTGFDVSKPCPLWWI